MQLTANNITKSFGEKQVLKGISLTAQSGKALGLLGRNGAGKTTTIRIIMGVFPPDSGEVLFDGVHIDRSKIKIGYLPEERGLYPKKLIVDQLVYFACLRGMTKKDAKISAKQVLERLEISEYTNKKLDTLSKGNQQKAQLAASLICNPDIIILDEPFSGLDPVNAMLFKDIVKELLAEGKIVLFSSHQMNYIEEFCNDIIIINDGNIALSGNIRDVKHNYDRSKIVVLSPEIDKIITFANDKLKDIVIQSKIVNNEARIKLVGADRKNALISALASENFDIDELRVYEPSLTDIFVEYTEGGI